jgi:hypothetical protein
LLGISEGAVRARIHRGSLETEREGGTVYVRLDADDTSNERTEQSELVQILREYNTSLERQLNAEREASAELRRIIAALTQRIPPQLEAPSEPRQESSPTAADETGRSEPRPQSEGRVPWWRRMFSG